MRYVMLPGQVLSSRYHALAPSLGRGGAQADEGPIHRPVHSLRLRLHGKDRRHRALQGVAGAAKLKQAAQSLVRSPSREPSADMISYKHSHLVPAAHYKAWELGCGVGFSRPGQVQGRDRACCARIKLTGLARPCSTTTSFTLIQSADPQPLPLQGGAGALPETRGLGARGCPALEVDKPRPW